LDTPAIPRLILNDWWDEEEGSQVPNPDEDLLADRDGTVNDLFIYQMDAPGHRKIAAEIVNDVYRQRLHFMEWVWYDNQLCSDGDPSDPINKPGFKWTFNHSTETVANGPSDVKLQEKGDLNASGDNRVIAGEWLGDLSENLAGGDASIPFRPKIIAITGAGSREKIPFEVILQDGLVNRPIEITGEGFPDAAPTIAFEQILPREPVTNIGVANPARVNETRLTATLDMSGHGLTKPGIYRVKITINAGGNPVTVVLVSTAKQLHVIGKATHWQFLGKPKLEAPNQYSIVFRGLDALNQAAKGTNAPPAVINELDAAPADMFTWLTDTIAFQDAGGEYYGTFSRTCEVVKSGNSKLRITTNDGDTPGVTLEYSFTKE
jgi:hypothetical protein